MKRNMEIAIDDELYKTGKQNYFDCHNKGTFLIRNNQRC